MEKRLVFAIALSILVLISWSALMPKPQVVENNEVITKVSPEALSTAQLQTQPELTVTSQIPAQETVTFVQPGREIIFDLQKAAIIEVVFKDGLQHKFPLKAGLLTENKLLFKLQGKGQDYISFVAEDKTKHVTKKFVFSKDNYSMELQEEIRNLSGSPIVHNQELILGYLDISAKNPQSRFQDIFLANKEKSYHLSAAKDYFSNEVKFIGLRDQYFCAIVQPVSLATDGFVRKINPQESLSGLITKNIVINPNAQIGHSYRIYLGPQDLKILNTVNPEWSGIIYFGVFDFIAQLLLQLLGFFYALVHNWGLAIIILSAAVYFILFPLSIKQMRSMKEMQILQPKIEALRKEYKDNPQRLNKEIMELYKEHKVNPLGGCLPLLLQMPIFFALYQGLIRSTSLRGAHFLWIKDLSSPDGAFVFDKSIPLLGNQLNVLPILMAIGMFVQQKISLAKASGEAAQQQKMMLVIMPIMFGVIFYQMPSGLVLYWFVNSLFMLGYQLRINKQT